LFPDSTVASNEATTFAISEASIDSFSQLSNLQMWFLTNAL
jgi:hypothetical protein